MINKVPDSFLRYGHHGDRCHLVKRIKDGTEALIVYKYWRPEKQRWQYMVENEYLILMALNQSESKKLDELNGVSDDNV